MRRFLPAGLTIVGVAFMLRFVFGASYLNYDAMYSLLWANDVVGGHQPDYNGFIAPTPHPLATLFSGLALPLGRFADDFLIATVLLTFGGIVWVMYRLGAVLFSRWVGVLAAVMVATRPAFDKNALLAYQDIPFVLFTLGAVLVEAKRPRAGWPVLALLALAGLLRPEGWVLAGLYFLYVALPVSYTRTAPFVKKAQAWPLTARGTLGLAALTAVGPALWMLSDLAITGDMLHSFHGTQDLAAQLDRPRSVADVPYRTALFFGFTLREPLILGVPIGLVFAWRFARASSRLPLVVAVVMTALFGALSLVGLPLIARYVLTPAALLALFYALGCLGWMQLADGPDRARWKLIGLASLALSVLYIPFHVALFVDLEERTDAIGGMQGDLRHLAVARETTLYTERCGRVSTTDHRPVPTLRYWLDAPPGFVQSTADPDHPLGDLLVVPASRMVAERFYDKVPMLTVPVGFRQVYANKSWRLLASAECRARDGSS